MSTCYPVIVRFPLGFLNVSFIEILRHASTKIATWLLSPGRRRSKRSQTGLKTKECRQVLLRRQHVLHVPLDGLRKSHGRSNRRSNVQREEHKLTENSLRKSKKIIYIEKIIGFRMSMNCGLLNLFISKSERILIEFQSEE